MEVVVVVVVVVDGKPWMWSGSWRVDRRVVAPLVENNRGLEEQSRCYITISLALLFSY